MNRARLLIARLIPEQTLSRKRIWFLLFIAALYVLLSLTVHLRLWAGFDLSTTLFLEQLIPRTADMPLSLFSLIGSIEVTGLCVLAFLLIACPPGSRLRLVALFLLIGLFEWVGKNIVYQPGPPNVFYRYVLPYSFPTADLETPYSFPSGHSARSVFLTLVFVVWIQQTGMSARTKRVLWGLVVVGETIMLVSRISLGEHWSTDVIGGILLALALALPWLYSVEPTPFAVPSRFSAQPGAPGD